MAQTNPSLWYNTPAKPDLTEALPVGNGRIGALVYGGENERIVLNDSSLWTGDENPSGNYKTMGSYQMLGELLLTPATSQKTFKPPIVSSLGGQKAYFPTQEVESATDGKSNTKWCVEHGGKPVIWQVQLPQDSIVTWYSFTSADDVPERDPSTWVFSGSNDGQNWTTLDTKQNQPPLTKRGDTAHYNFTNTTAYPFYRLTVQPNPGVTHFQIAEIGLGGAQQLNLDPESAPLPADFRRSLDLTEATATTQYTENGVHYRREIFASNPADVIVVRWSADKAGALSGTIDLKGAHDETTTVNGNDLSFRDQFANGLQYATQVRVMAQGGTTSIVGGQVQLNGCNEALVLLGAGTNYIFDYARKYCGPDPCPRVTAQVNAAAKQSFASLKSAHIAQFQKVFKRVSLDLGTSSSERLALPTDSAEFFKGKKAMTPTLKNCSSSAVAICSFPAHALAEFPPICKGCGTTRTIHPGTATITPISTSR